MKICDVVCNSVWYDPRVRKQIIEYKNNGVDISCVGMRCNRYDIEKISELPYKVNVVCIDEKYDGYQKGIVRKLWREHLRNKAMRKAIYEEKPDVIHANDLDALMICFPVAKLLRCKIVYDSHEICAENVGTKRRYNIMLPLIKKYEGFMARHIDQMVCVSNAAADYFEKLFKIKRPMVITNCSLKSDMVVTDGNKNNGFEVLNHGTFYAGRGYETMVKAGKLLEDMPEVKMALRGFGVIEDELKALRDELKVENVVFYPKVKVEELIPLASKSMVGVAITEPICLNFKLSVSNKLFEYASAGLPVIMSDIPEHRYLNEKYEFGIVLKDDSPEELSTAVRKLYLDKDFYKTCKENAIRLAQEINWENDFKQLVEKETEWINK